MTRQFKSKSTLNYKNRNKMINYVKGSEKEKSKLSRNSLQAKEYVNNFKARKY